MTLGISTEGMVEGGGVVDPAPAVAFTSPTPNTTPGSGGGFSADYATAAATPIVVQITDTNGDTAFAFIAVTAVFQGGASELVYRNAFAGVYVVGSSVSSLSNGMQLNIVRGGGWPGATAESNLAVGLIVDVCTTDGKVYSSTAYYELPAAGVLATSSPQPVAAPGTVDHVADALSFVSDQFRSRL